MSTIFSKSNPTFLSVTSILIAGLVLLFCNAAMGQSNAGERIPDNWKAIGSSLDMSDQHYKEGKQSIRWTWNGSATLVISDTAFTKAVSDDHSCFAIWIYNEKPVRDSIRFNFGTSQQTACSFTFNLNFSGWRTAWVMYHRDMQGKPVPGMNQLRIIAPTSVKTGQLFFDQLVYCTTVDYRAPMRDAQVPFVNEKNGDKAANAHWTALYHFSRIPHHLSQPQAMTEQDKADLLRIRQRYENILLAGEHFKANQLAALDTAFQFYHIQQREGNLTGRPINSINAWEINSELPLAEAKALAKAYGVENAADLLLKQALAYRSTQLSATEKKKISEQFVLLLLHLHDQGWAYGSGMGSLHHLGYNFRNYYSACLLMQSVLKEQGLQEMIGKDMYWFSGLGRTKADPQQLPSSNIDVFNTLLGSMLSSILFMEDGPEKLLQFREFSQWLSHNIGPEYGIEGTFKPDGSIMHHGTLYPAYAIDGLKGLAPIIYAISNTGFSISSDAYEVVKKALLRMYAYCNPVYWPISVSGRHPTGNWSIAADPFAYLAAAKEKQLDTALAAVYLRLADAKTKTNFAAMFKKQGILAAGNPSGHWDINYGLLSIHRRNNWLLTVRGHNRYFVTHESYPGANMYGRYLTYGNTELLYPQDSANNGTYFKDEGWDWNHIPGTTTLNLPLDKLRSRIINADDFSGVEEMLLSDELFCGGSSLGKQGIYAMKLHGHDKYDMGNFRAIKSWFMFDSLIICLGSNIRDTHMAYPTQTTLFQNYLQDTAALLMVNQQRHTGFPLQQEWKASSGPLTVLDNRNIGYYLKDARSAKLSKQQQFSRNQQDTKNTSGAFASLVIDHGAAPKNGAYEYAMMIGSKADALQHFKAEMSGADPVYRVLRKDSIAHIVNYQKENTTAAALFDANTLTGDSLVARVSRPCLLMYQNNKDLIRMSVTDPDLGFYEGPDDTPLLPDGKRKEVSIYSKKWYATPAHPSVVELVLNGTFRLAENNGKASLQLNQRGQQVLKINCSYGAPTLFNLIPVH